MIDDAIGENYKIESDIPHYKIHIILRAVGGQHVHTHQGTYVLTLHYVYIYLVSEAMRKR